MTFQLDLKNEPLNFMKRMGFNMPVLKAYHRYILKGKKSKRVNTDPIEEIIPTRDIEVSESIFNKYENTTKTSVETIAAVHKCLGEI